MALVPRRGERQESRTRLGWEYRGTGQTVERLRIKPPRRGSDGVIAGVVISTGLSAREASAADEKLPLGKPGEAPWVGEQRRVVRDGDLTGIVDPEIETAS